MPSFLQCPVAVRKTNNWITNLLHIGRYDNCSKKIPTAINLCCKEARVAFRIISVCWKMVCSSANFIIGDGVYVGDT